MGTRYDQPKTSARPSHPGTTHKVNAQPDPEPLLSFAEAVQQQQAGGHPEAAHRRPHPARSLAIRLGRKLQYDPDKRYSSMTRKQIAS